VSTGKPDEVASGGSEFINDAMTEDEATTRNREATTAAIAGAPASPAGPTSHAKKSWRKPATWAISAAAALVVGLVIGLLLGGGKDPAPAASAPETTRPAATSEVGQVVTSLAHIAPVQLIVPAIGVDTSMVNLGLNVDGTLEVPVDYAKAGWFTGGNYPGDPSGPPGLIAGHVDDTTGPAVFYDLRNLVAGDEVHVVRADNTVAVFAVTATAQYPKSEFPAAELYAPVESSEIVLITCTGDFNENTRSYLDNYVVRAQLNLERSLEESNLRAAEGMTPPAVNQENA